MRRALKEGIVKRDELFITSKLWNNYHAKEHVLEMANYENKRWGVEYLDLVRDTYDGALTGDERNEVKRNKLLTNFFILFSI